MNIGSRSGRQQRQKGPGLKWEYLGKQELWDSPMPGGGHCYSPIMWRTPVPGGWLIVVINSRTNLPQPTTTFYPDPDHAWSVKEDLQQAYLLRPAAGAIASDSEELLRPSDLDEPMRMDEEKEQES